MPLIDGRRSQSYDSIYGAYMGTQRAIIQDGWKLIAYPKLKKLKLFNLDKDAAEIHDLSGSPEYASQLATMQRLLEAKMDEMGDPMSSIAAADYLKMSHNQAGEH